MKATFYSPLLLCLLCKHHRTTFAEGRNVSRQSSDILEHSTLFFIGKERGRGGADPKAASNLCLVSKLCYKYHLVKVTET